MGSGPNEEATVVHSANVTGPLWHTKTVDGLLAADLNWWGRFLMAGC